MPRIFDNIETHLNIGLNETLADSKRADFCVGYFNLRGWKQVADHVEKMPGETIEENGNPIHRVCRLIIGMHKTPKDLVLEYYSNHENEAPDQATAVRLKKQIALEFRAQLTFGIPTEEDEKSLRKLSVQLKAKKVCVKLYLKHDLHAKLYLGFRTDRIAPVVGFVGSSNLTFAGLARQGELNVDVVEQDAAVKLSKWFDDRWNDRLCLDISDDLIEIIDSSWATEELRSPYHIYLKMAYHLSREARAGLNEYKLPRVFQNELLDFQKKAVLIAAHHLNKRSGVVIGDVVGLGKTITACAIAKIFEEDFYLETLILCPKNLVSMWEGYVHKYQLHAKVLSVSMVQRQLPELRRYRIVIIDESHNLRNSEGSRYRAIKEYLTENDSKVILLSATPYNKSYVDLSNQLRLFVADDKDLGIMPENYIRKLGGQNQFFGRHTETFIRSIKAFEKSDYAEDWRELMRLYMVRRTRSFIKANYADVDASNGRRYLTFHDGRKSYFPDRLPKKMEYVFKADDPKDQYARLYTTNIVEIISGLKLPRYGLGNYLDTRPTIKLTESEKTLNENLSKAGRRLVGFCRTNLFKRLESSGYAFLLSLSRHILRNYIFIYAIENRLALPIGKNITSFFDEFVEDQDTEQDNGDIPDEFTMSGDANDYLKQAKTIYKLIADPGRRNRFEWVRDELFTKELTKDLLEDAKNMLGILKIAGTWKASADAQLIALHKLIEKTHSEEKVLIFTQFADTAHYLKDQLERLKVKRLDVVTGDNENPTGMAHKFSPRSNEQHRLVGSIEELRVLVSTDVLSEGQNLQDAHIIVNYDLPWAIIRLIQRAGRVDRIGQESEKILCYSCLPTEGVERIIGLRRRLTERIKQNAEVVGSDEVFFDGDPINIHDLYSERSGILDDEENEGEVDLASMAYQIWKNATDKEPGLKKTIPNLPDVVYATKQQDQFADQIGVVVYARTADDNDMMTYLNTSGQIITQSQLAILRAAECLPSTRPMHRIVNHHELVGKAIKQIQEEDVAQSGALGRPTGIKYRTYMRLDRYIKENENTLFVNEPLKRTVDDIFKFPLKEFAKESIGRQLKAGISDEDLASLVVSLRDEGKLSIVEEEVAVKQPQIICSLGVTGISK